MRDATRCARNAMALASSTALVCLVLAASPALAQAPSPAAAPAPAASEPLDPKKLYLRRSCIACHGKDGKKAIQDYPSLAGQKADYMIAQIEDIISGKRVGGPDASGNPRSKGMRGALVAPDGARRITPDEVKAISTWLAAMEPAPFEPPATPQPPDKAAAAAKIFAEKCEACHGPAGKAPQEGFPLIAGQKQAYVLAQLKDIKSKARTNGQAEAMQAVMEDVSDADIELLAAYVAAQNPGAK